MGFVGLGNLVEFSFILLIDHLQAYQNYRSRIIERENFFEFR